MISVFLKIFIHFYNSLLLYILFKMGGIIILLLATKSKCDYKTIQSIFND